MLQTRHVPFAKKVRLSVDADVSIPTVIKALRGEPVRGRAGERIRTVLAREGLLPDNHGA